MWLARKGTTTRVDGAVSIKLKAQSSAVTGKAAMAPNAVDVSLACVELVFRGRSWLTRHGKPDSPSSNRGLPAVVIGPPAFTRRVSS